MINSDYDKLMLEMYRRVFTSIRENGHTLEEDFDLAFHEVLGMSMALNVLENVVEEKKEEADKQMFEFLNEVVAE